MNDLIKRVGRYRIPRGLFEGRLDGLETVYALAKHVVVFDIKYCVRSRTYVCEAYSPLFDVVEGVEPTPCYQLEISKSYEHGEPDRPVFTFKATRAAPIAELGSELPPISRLGAGLAPAPAPKVMGAPAPATSKHASGRDVGWDPYGDD